MKEIDPETLKVFADLGITVINAPKKRVDMIRIEMDRIAEKYGVLLPPDYDYYQTSGEYVGSKQEVESD